MFLPSPSVFHAHLSFPRVRGDVPDSHPRLITYLVCFPRVRGDVPVWLDESDGVHMFSPRARGCSYCPRGELHNDCVFPACAGMFLPPTATAYHRHRFPRVRGDVPSFSTTVRNAGKFSPRARGCSRPPLRSVVVTDVFPACAGMFREKDFRGTMTGSFPRVRGDVPCAIQFS